MSCCRTMVLIAAGAVLAGCAATLPPGPGVTGPGAPGGAGTEVADAREVVVEAEGIAHMGDKDRREDVEARAEWEAIEQAAGKAFGLRVREIVKTDGGILVMDTRTRTVVGTFTSLSRIDEEFDGSRYRIRVRAEGRRERIGAEALRPPGGTSSEGQEQAADTGAAPPATSPEPPAGNASAPASGAVPASGGAPAAGQAETAMTEAAPATPGGAAVDDDPVRRAETAMTEAAPATPVVSSRSREAVTVCCRGFPRPLVKRVRDTRFVLERARGVVRVEEVGATDDGLCYRIHHDGSMESIDEWIEQLRTDAALPFKRRHDRGARTIDLVFDAGFD